MKGLFCFFAGLTMSMALVPGALGQPDCEVIIRDLNQSIQKPDAFDVAAFLVKHGLEYTSCPVKNGVAYCFKCLYKGSVSALEIAITDNGLQISPPRYGCSCHRGQRSD
jgi:hypothetical protein